MKNKKTYSRVKTKKVNRNAWQNRLVIRKGKRDKSLLFLKPKDVIGKGSIVLGKGIGETRQINGMADNYIFHILYASDRDSIIKISFPQIKKKKNYYK